MLELNDVIELDKGFRVEILQNHSSAGPDKVRLAFIPQDGAMPGLTPQQARILATALIKAAHLADAKITLEAEARISQAGQ